MNPGSTPAVCRREYQLDQGWTFRHLAEPSRNGMWTTVDLPHCPFVPDLDGREHWFGECEYRRIVRAPRVADGERVLLHVGAAMHTAQVCIDGGEIGRHAGGYLPFVVDLTDALTPGRDHELILRLDNRDNPDVPPGKPFDELDFCWYGGLYRDVRLRVQPAVHITDPLQVDEVAGGGVFCQTLTADEASATVRVRTHVRNLGSAADGVTLEVCLELSGTAVATQRLELGTLGRGAATHVACELTIPRPRLWSPEAPVLHELVVTLRAGDEVCDEHRERVGLRRISFSRSGGFVLNGRRRRLRGTNRHQEFPRVGYALSRAAEYRDARRLKEAGFDYVRLSHYPQSPAFLDACDELGIVVMNCLPGWQFLGGETFRAACFETARQMIRRDRNHACVVLWELSLNETPMDDAFMDRLHAIGHEEYPGDQMFTCGWIDRYDVFLRSRQHGEIHTWRNGDKALVIAEYGDWEYYAANEGFNQKTGAGLHPEWMNARKRRADGEAGLRQQVAKHVEALNDTLASPAVLDGHWCLFDYARGYNAMRATCGVMDVFRLPKFSYHFYRSQRDPDEGGVNWTGGPVVFIASHWLPTSNLQVPVFSNCEEVELRLNGALVGRLGAGRSRTGAENLPHPPFIFELPAFSSGVLEATGFIAGAAVCTHRVATPGPAVRLELTCDVAGRATAVGEPDVLVVHATWRDAQDVMCVTETAGVAFALHGDGVLLGPADVAAEAGVASVVVRLPAAARELRITAQAVARLEITANLRLERESPAPGLSADESIPARVDPVAK